MKTFYLVKDVEGTRFIPSEVLRHYIPCTVLGIMQIFEDYIFTIGELKSFNEVIRKFENDE